MNVKEMHDHLISMKRDGLPQKETWNGLGITSREGARLLKELEEKGLIIRKKELHEKKWTYKIYLVNKNE